MTVLVTGGAGYIGSHIVNLLAGRGPVLAVDDLSTGDATRLPDVELLAVDLALDDSVETVRRAILERNVDSVVHLAALKQAAGSVLDPVRYFDVNMGSLAHILAAMEGTAANRFVFSSSAAVYGNASNGVVDEHSETAPLNPYGETKLAGEWLTRNVTRAFGLRAVSLRYFNVAGADNEWLGDSMAQNLITKSIAAVLRGEDPVVYGSDFDTPDGSGVRDYIHVSDLAAAHVAALDYLDEPREYSVFNVGTGRGASVWEVLEELRAASGIDFAPEIAPRRAGDPAAVVADPSLIRRELGWVAQRILADMVESAWDARACLALPDS